MTALSTDKIYKNSIGDTVRISSFDVPHPNAIYCHNLDGVEFGEIYIELEPHTLVEVAFIH